MTIHSSYLKIVYNRKSYNKQLNETFNVLQKIKRKTTFDSIAFTGTSGAAFAYPLANMLNVSLICVRKQTENSHSPYEVEGFGASKNFIIIDDFYASGLTLTTILRKIKNFYDEIKKPKPRFRGVLLYNDSENGIISYLHSDHSRLGFIKGIY